MPTPATDLPWFGTGWKMTKTRPEAVDYAKAIAKAAPGFISEVNTFVLPAYPLLDPVAQVLTNSGIQVGAQNVHWEDTGPFTGEVSAPMLTEIGVTLTALGHAERRAMFGETDETVRQRTAAALRHGITPLICVGESAADRRAGRAAPFVTTQVETALQGLRNDQVSKVMIAYEPVWAIGEGSTPATAAEADDMHAVIRQVLLSNHGDLGQSVPLLYGGSVSSAAAPELISCPNINGLFVGRAAWTEAGFIELAKIVAQAGRTS